MIPARIVLNGNIEVIAKWFSHSSSLLDILQDKMKRACTMLSMTSTMKHSWEFNSKIILFFAD